MVRNVRFAPRLVLLVGLLTAIMQPACVVCTTGQCGGADQAVSGDSGAADDLPVTQDLPVTPDLATPDLATPDLATPDLATPDLATPDLMPPADLMPRPAPTVTAVNPAEGPTSGGTTLTITGQSFVAGATVTLNGIAATVVNVAATTITVVTPAAPGAFGKVPLVVRNPDGQMASATLFTYFSSSVAFPDPVYETGKGPSWLASGDFNGDGKKDLIAANNGNFGSDNSLTILLGDGKGGFSPGSTFVPFGGQTNPYAVATGDFNNDNKVDIAFTDLNGDRVLVGLGNGNGSFSITSIAAVGVAPQGLALGDFNGDNKLDVVTANGLDDSVSVRFGDGMGGLPNVSAFSVGSTPAMVSAADVNGDGKLDLITINSGSDDLSVLLGDGTGKFNPSPKGPFAASGLAESLTVGDVNGDGKVDLVYGSYSVNRIGVLIGDGAGGFAAAVNYSTTLGGPVFLTLADVNGDNRPDLITAIKGGGNLLLNDGTGKFNAAVVIPAGAVTAAVAAVDLNGDGKLDLAFANGNNGAQISNNVSVVLNNGAGQFAPVGGLATLRGGGAPSVAPGDLNGDGKLDLVYATSNRVVVVLGDGAGGSAVAGTLYVAGPGAPRAVVVADFNNDAKLDVAASDSTGVVAVLLGDGAGKLGAAATTPAGANPQGVAAVDLNGDNFIDLVVVNQGGNNISVLLGKGNGTFNAAVNYAAGAAPFGVTVGDFNNDAKLDVIVSNPGGTSVNLLLGNGNGTFGNPTSVPAGNRPFGLASADVNGDGKRDLIVANQATDTVANVTGDNAVGVLLGNGNGTFGNPTKFPVGTSPFAVAVGDLNGDGRVDIAAANAQGGSAGVLLGNGSGGFTFNGNYNATSASSVAVGDFNRDGKPDIVAGNSILLNGSR